MQLFNDYYIYILLHNNKLYLNYIESYRDKTIILKDHQKYDLATKRVIIDGIIFNINYVKNLIKNFIDINKITNNLKSKNLIIILGDNNNLYQNISLDINQNFKNINSDYIQDYNISSQNIKIDSKDLIYQIAIENSKIFQYNLLALELKLNLRCLTTIFMPCYYFYKSIYDNRSNSKQNNFFNIFNNNLNNNSNNIIHELEVIFKNIFKEKIELLTQNWPKYLINRIDKDILITILGSNNLL